MMTEEQIKELGYTLVYEYDHDIFHTNRYRNGLITVEFTYEDDKLVTVEMEMEEVNNRVCTIEELKAITPVFGDNPVDASNKHQCECSQDDASIDFEASTIICKNCNSVM